MVFHKNKTNAKEAEKGGKGCTNNNFGMVCSIYESHMFIEMTLWHFVKNEFTEHRTPIISLNRFDKEEEDRKRRERR